MSAFRKIVVLVLLAAVVGSGFYFGATWYLSKLEQDAWAYAQQAATEKAFLDYLRRYESGAHARQAIQGINLVYGDDETRSQSAEPDKTAGP